MSEDVMSREETVAERKVDDLRADWCVLRTSGGRTIPLAKSLAEAGLDVWTPVERQSRRRPRSKAKVEIETAIMPTFVFARARHLPELASILTVPMSPHPPFSIFRSMGGIPLLAERDIANVRAIEERRRIARLKTRKVVLPAGFEVKLEDGPFAGMSGVVQGGDGSYAVVAFNGGFVVKIATFLFHENDVEQTQPISGTAAKAA